MSVSIQDAVRRYAGQTAVDGLSLKVETGELVAVVGPSGCGKSTLLRLVAGLDTLDGGEVSLGGRVVARPGLHLPPEARGVGVVFQSYALWPHMNVRDNVAFPLETAGSGRQAARVSAEGPLATVGLTALADRRPADLSGGQRQRVALARCLAQGARTILMDEPLANLDPHLRAAMEEELAAFHARTGATTIYITHDQREAFAIADRVAVMQAGRILQCAAPETIHDRPASAAVARFIGRGALLAARRRGDMADLGPLRVPVAGPGADGPVLVLVRPGDVVAGGDGHVTGRLRAVLYRGGQWDALAEVEGLAEPLALTLGHKVRPGETLPLTIRAAWAIPVAP
ncbi:MAG: ABC transporter ATP-binding protein [Gemmobacter sp.]